MSELELACVERACSSSLAAIPKPCHGFHHSTDLLCITSNRSSSQKGSHPLAGSVKENTQPSQRGMPKAVEGSLNAVASQHKGPVQPSIAVEVAFSFYFAPEPRSEQTARKAKLRKSSVLLACGAS